MIHTIARYAAVLKRDGLSEPQALRKIDDVLRLRALSDGRHATTVEEYLELLLAARCPEYLSHSPGLLTAALALARAEIEPGLPPMVGSPPSEWLTARMSTEEFKQEFDRLLNATQWFVPSLEDRLAFGQGLRDRLAAPTSALDPKNPAIKTPDVDAPRAEAEQQLPTFTTFDSGARENQPLVMDERRWSLPFDSQEYAIADLPVTPEASFRAEITASAFVNEPVSVTAQNDIPVVARVSRSMRKVERRQKVLIQRRIVRVQTLPPAVVAAAIAQQQAYAQQQAAAPPPFLFFLGAPPPSAAPPSEENAPPKKPFLFPELINDIFKNEY